MILFVKNISGGPNILLNVGDIVNSLELHLNCLEMPKSISFIAAVSSEYNIFNRVMSL